MDIFNKITWGIATILLVISGIYYTFKLNFIQFNFKRMFAQLKPREKQRGFLNRIIKPRNNSDSISPFETLTMALGARIGVGSLAGIALGICRGGPGVIFWIWLSAIITAPNALVESTLAVKYRERDGKYYKGGPAYYIRKGLNYRVMATIYAIVLAVCYLGGFLAIQSNTIAASLKDSISLPTYITGVLVCIIAFIIIIKGVKGIASFTSKLVPFMGIGYLIICIIVLAININSIPLVFGKIIGEAFNFKALGWGLFSIMLMGVQRGIFSSESGIGTGAVASGTSDTDSSVDQGFIQMFGIYFTIFIVCTATAIIILSSNIDLTQFTDINGIEVTNRALTAQLGSTGYIVLILAIISFAFSTIISGYYYGESNIKYLFKNVSNKGILILKIMVLGVLFYGAIAKPSSLWNIVDIGVGLLAIINIIAILFLRKDMISEYKDYRRKILNDRK